ncbi:DEAD/DEAH box helicase family protein [Arthrobacter sp. MMS18-M83]|uniref:DEAD/DEAH box helicase family protein n=1 Tax=Arthrobacter sp. MMS18-M83 TaxID=2996261 RepID=UPI00227C3F94|nr:DEAD/DEAH box helicase family protein [Arthrobacter sp. MMS18-M83]WAH97343.1 hypothetical protein OW521_00055 [Arthrobacter sp. MMS18-M83]
MISAVKHAASMPNPEFYERQRQRRSTWNRPRYLRNYDETPNGDLILPRGLLPFLQQLVESSGSSLRIDDQRVVAPPGTGKTAPACAAMAIRRVSTLILVDRKALAEQWRSRIREFLDEHCGQIGGGRAKMTGRIDVAPSPTLAGRLHVSQNRVSRIERDDIDCAQVETLREYVEALGGRLRVEVALGDERIQIA